MSESKCPKCQSPTITIAAKQFDLNTGQKIVGKGGFVASLLTLPVGLILFVGPLIALIQSGFEQDALVNYGLILVVGGLISRTTLEIVTDYLKANRAMLNTVRCRKCKYTWKEFQDGARPSFKPLLDRLKDDDPQNRAQAAKGLGDMIVTEAEADLLSALDDESETVRLSVVESLGTMLSASVMDALSRTVINDTHPVQVEAAKLLATHGDAKAVEAICTAIRTTTPESRKSDFLDGSLSSIKNPDAVGPLVKAMGDGDPILHQFASRNLANIDDGIVRNALKAANKN